MLVWWLWVLSVTSQELAGASNLTTTTKTTSLTSTYSYGDACTNQCEEGDSTHWCKERRVDPEGFISRCQTYTQSGVSCLSKCTFDEYWGYSWCMTNSAQVSSYGWWGKCSLPGFTINHEKCVDACDYRENWSRRYYWCHTSTSWDYCSPPGRVTPWQLNIKGGLCRSECAHGGKDYTWCKKNIFYWKSGSSTDWEYCSLDNMHTRYGEQCKDSCSSRGESYYWCHTEDNWDYCSPKAVVGDSINLKVERDIYGNECLNACSQRGEKYFWCDPIEEKANRGLWEYCSKEDRTIYNALCKDSCSQRGESYYWCHTLSSSGWDYCSPTKAGATGAQAPIMAVVITVWITASNI